MINTGELSADKE